MPGPPPELRRGRGLSNRASGDLGEEMARRYLASKGYDIVESNYRTSRGEPDLISRQDNTLVIVEVSLRRGTAYGTPLDAVTPRKQQLGRGRAGCSLWPRPPGSGVWPAGHVVSGVNAREAACTGGGEVYGVRSLREAAEFLRSGSGMKPAELRCEEKAGHEEAGQAYAKRALGVGRPVDRDAGS